MKIHVVKNQSQQRFMHKVAAVSNLVRLVFASRSYYLVYEMGRQGKVNVLEALLDHNR